MLVVSGLSFPCTEAAGQLLLGIRARLTARPNSFEGCSSMVVCKRDPFIAVFLSGIHCRWLFERTSEEAFQTGVETCQLMFICVASAVGTSAEAASNVSIEAQSSALGAFLHHAAEECIDPAATYGSVW